jgi:hypothetical protein
MKAPGWSSSEDIIPNNLSVDKIKALNNKAEMSKSNITEKIGLFVTYNDNPLNYSYNISLRDFSDNPIFYNSNPLLQVGDSIPESGATIEKIERIIAIDNSMGLTNCTTKIGDVNCAKLVVCIWR